MKHLFLLLLFCAVTPLLSQTSGKITYQQTTQVQIPDRVPKEFRDRFPKERKINKELYFNQSKSTYKNGENIRQGEGEVGGGDRGGRFRGRMMGGGNANSKTYKDLEAKLIVDNRDIMGKVFIIEEDLTKVTWKMTGQKKTILNYMVMEATTNLNDSIPVLAYFAPQIPISNGPSMFHGLPGMILEVNINNGQNVITANNIELIEIAASDLERPSTGKKVTKEEFDQIRKEKIEEMREQRGGSRGGRFRTSGN